MKCSIPVASEPLTHSASVILRPRPPATLPRPNPLSALPTTYTTPLGSGREPAPHPGPGPGPVGHPGGPRLAPGPLAARPPALGRPPGPAQRQPPIGEID